MRFDGVLIFLEVSDGIAPCVGVFFHKVGPVGVLLGPIDNPFNGLVGEVVGINDAVHLTILEQTRWVGLAGVFGHCFYVITEAGLVTKRPEDDRGMVFVPLDDAGHSVHRGSLPFRVAAGKTI